MDLDALVAPLRADVRGGAAELAGSAVALFEAALAESAATDVEDFRAFLSRLAARTLEAQPSMAPLVTLAATVLLAASGTASVEEARAATRRALDRFRERIRSASREAAARAEGLIPAGGRVLTVSSSSTVRAALLEAAKRRSFDVVCLEGRPNFEGRSLAAALAAAGVRVTLAVDAAVAAVIRGCDVVLTGADSIGDLGVVNKIGTRPAAQAAKSAGIPIYALADTTKILPCGVPQLVEDDRPAAEVWPEAPPGVAIWNRYFEATPLSLFAGVVTEAGLRTPAELEQMRAGLELPAELHRLLARG
jgi:translation initiation factor 2B subunit (eIF-2B alpha/beta/delta family)